MDDVPSRDRSGYPVPHPFVGSMAGLCVVLVQPPAYPHRPHKAPSGSAWVYEIKLSIGFQI
jgi:hypothetical protein